MLDVPLVSGFLLKANYLFFTSTLFYNIAGTIKRKPVALLRIKTSMIRTSVSN